MSEQTASQALALSGIDIASMQKPVDAPCIKCGTIVPDCREFFAGATHCDKCYAEVVKERRFKEIGEWWTRWCPKQYQSTELDHPQFKRVWPLIKKIDGYRENVVLVGASGLCKTRAAVMRLKLALAYEGLMPQALWADTLDEKLETGRFKGDWKKVYMDAPILLIDDLFTAGASLERYTKFIKGLLDYRLREEKPTIITTNLKARDIQQESNKFDNETKADQQRINAIIRRLREFRCVDFDSLGDGRF